MSKPNITIATIKDLLRFGRFESDLELLKLAAERYGRCGYNDRRRFGKRIKLGVKLSTPAMQFIADGLANLFKANTLVCDFKWKIGYNFDRLVTAIYVNQ